MTKNDPKKQSNSKLSSKELESFAKELAEAKANKKIFDDQRAIPEQMLKNNTKVRKNPKPKFADRVEGIKNLLTDKEGINADFRKDIKEYIKKQPIDAAIELVTNGPRVMLHEVNNQKYINQIDEKKKAAAPYEKIIKDIQYKTGQRDPFAELKSKYGVTLQNSKSNQDQNKSLPKSKGKSSSYER